MVKRYPHTAIVTIDVNGKTVNGEWVPGKPIEISVPGRYDPVSDGTVVYKRNSAGDEAQVTFTRTLVRSLSKQSRKQDTCIAAGRR